MLVHHQSADRSWPDEPMCDAWTLGGTCSLGQTHTEYVSHGGEPGPVGAAIPVQVTELEKRIHERLMALARGLDGTISRVRELEERLSPPTVVAKPTCTARLYLQPRGSAGEDACVLPAGHDSVHCDKDGYRWNISYE